MEITFENVDFFNKSQQAPSKSVHEDYILKLSNDLRNLIQSQDTNGIALQFLSSEVIRAIQKSLNSPTPVILKHGVFLLKSLTSYFLNSNCDKLDGNALQLSGIMLHNGKFEFKQFWIDFFDLYEILNEKQFHIIEPFLAKLKTPRFQSKEAMGWLMILVDKMLNHDNRILAKEGLGAFLNYGLSLPAQVIQASREDQLDFVRSSLFPVLKDRVGWILVEPKALMESAEKLGKLLQILDCNDLEPFSYKSSALKLILDSDTDMGPVVTYFLALAAFNQLSGKGHRFPPSEMRLASFSVEATKQYECFLEDANYCLMFRLTAIDRFLKTRIQHLFIDMVVQQLCYFELPGILHRANLDAHHAKDKIPSLHLKVFDFLGALDANIFCYSAEKLKRFLVSENSATLGLENDKLHSWVLDRNNWGIEHLLLSQINHSPLRMKGFLRWLLLHKILLKTSDASASVQVLSKQFANLLNDILKNKFKDELFRTTKEEFEAILDFLRCFVTIGKLMGDFDKDTVQVLLSLSSQCLVNCIYELIEETVSETVFLNKTLKILPLFNYAISQVQSVSEDSFFDKLEPLIASISGLPGVSQILMLNLVLLLDEACCSKLFKDVEREQFINNGKNLLLSDQLSILNLTDSDNNKNDILRNFNNLKIAVLSALCTQTDNQSTFFQSKDDVSKLFDTGLFLMETGADSSLPQAINICKIVADLAFQHEYDDILVEIASNGVQKAWKGVRELHKSEHFWDACSSFVSLISSPSFSSRNILSTYTSKIFDLSDTVSGLPLLLAEALSRAKVRTLRSEEKYSDYLRELVAVNVQASCFGSAVPKSLKLTFNLWEYMCANEAFDSLAASGNYERKISLPFNGNVKGRLISLLNILALLEVAQEDGKAECFLVEVVQKLLAINEGDSVDKRRYFVGSQIHRVKQRIVQILLVLQPYFDKDLSQEVMKTLLISLGNDGPQASVRYLTEWIIIKILLKYPELHEIFFTVSSECCLLRPGFGALFATIVLHTSVNLSTKSQYTKDFIDSALQNLTALLMSQNFTVRIYGNISLCKIFETAVNSKLVSVIPKFEVIYKCAQQTVATAAGNFRKIYDSVLNDFYVKIFSPLDHYFYDVIFIHLPRISKMCADEIIHEADLKEIDLNFRASIKLGLPYFSPSEVQCVYKDNNEYSWHLKTTLIDGREQGEEMADVGGTTNDPQLGNMLQVKGNPWKYLPVADEIQDFPQEIQLKKKSREGGLVVVASLIDRIPNLGGLCRTCEVFGASKYIISSLKFLDDQQFKSLSVSAHRWVEILEVPVQDLKSLLSSYSSKGYTIVGVEQALESKKLNSFAFPKKSLLLLGNEKYGIPTDLLGLCDICVEIPQVGLIRSLNVHVTGALCIWQYAAQHII